MKTSIYTILILIFSFICNIINAQSFVWAKSVGGNLAQQGYAIAVDTSGNVYTTGIFDDTADFDPGPGVFNLVSAGGYDIFVSKLDINGNFVWAKNISGPGLNRSYSICVDATGNVYTTGTFDGTTDFDPGPNTFNLTSISSADIFISKLDPAGNFAWAKQIGTSLFNVGTSITSDIAGNIFTTGYFLGLTDFDPGMGIFNLTSAGSNDIFILKLDTSGNFIWAKRMGGLNDDYGRGISVCSNGDIYTTGYYKGTSDFDPGLGVFNLSAPATHDVFISKLDALGNFVWAKSITGSDDDFGFALATDAMNNVYATGCFQGTADFDPGVATYNLTTAGLNDIFILKLNTLGNFVWAKQIGGIYDDYARGIASDVSGTVYTAGNFKGTVDFDPGPGVDDLISTGNNFDIFISKLDTAGNYISGKQLGGTGYDDCNSIAADGQGNVYTTGLFIGTADFDPGNGIFNLISAGGQDVFVSKLGNLPTDLQVVTAKSFIIFPNPANDITTIACDEQNIEVQIILKDLYGKTILSKNVYKAIENIRLDIAAIASGIYILSVKTSNGISKQTKLIKE
jgi:hypothetical protein